MSPQGQRVFITKHFTNKSPHRCSYALTTHTPPHTHTAFCSTLVLSCFNNLIQQSWFPFPLMTTSLWTQMSSLFQYFFVSCLASLQSTTSLKKHSLPQLKWATCFWQMEAMANVDKWTEQPGGFYESAAAWQIYLLSHHSSLCWGWALLTFHSTIAPARAGALPCVAAPVHALRRCCPVIHQYF